MGDDEIVKTDPVPDCATCEFNRPLWESQRGVLLAFGTLLLFLAWATSLGLSLHYKVTIDNTILSEFSLAIFGGWAFYFYSKEKTESVRRNMILSSQN